MAIRESLWASFVAVTTTTMVATTVAPPPMSERDKHVVSEAAVMLSAVQTETVTAPTILTDPSQLSEGLRLIGAVSAPTAEDRAAALSAADVPAETTADDELFGDGSLARELLSLYISGGPSAVVAYVSLALSDAVFGEDSIPSQLLGEYFDGGPQAVVAYATLALSDAIFGEDSFASGLVTSWFYGYPFDDEDAQGAYAGVVHYVIDTVIGLAEQPKTPVDEDSDVEAASDETTGEEALGDQAPPAGLPGGTDEEGPATGLLERTAVAVTTVIDESTEEQAPDEQSEDGLDALGDTVAGEPADSSETGADDTDGGAETIDEITQLDDEESEVDDAIDDADEAAVDDDAVDDAAADDEATSPEESDDDSDKKESAESTKTAKDSDDKGADNSDGGDSE